eukprot:SAG25_NODE_8216_length_433_cov_0.619760_1_plen_93_part_10
MAAGAPVNVSNLPLACRWCVHVADFIMCMWLALGQVADFGLSKDKELDTMKQTVKMTGCGSSLWMVSLRLLATSSPHHRSAGPSSLRRCGQRH